MEVKDYLAIAISLLAFILSLVATILSLRNKSYEEERISRSQLNDTITRIIGARIEHAKYSRDHPDWNENLATSNVLNVINYQINTFARLAVYIADRIPSLVNDIEYATIAEAFSSVGDPPSAIHYWEAAITKSQVGSKSDHTVQEATTRRNFADFLFRIGDIGGGQKQYKTALDLLPIKDSDYSKWMNGFTERMWGVSEGNASFRNEATKHFDRAEEIYKRISSEYVRNFALDDLVKVRQMIFQGNIRPGSLPLAPTDSAQLSKQ